MIPPLIRAMLEDQDCPQEVFKDAIEDLRQTGVTVATVYVVTGECGDYSDWRLWLVKGFLDKGEAEQFRDMAQRWEEDNLLRVRESDDPRADEHKPEFDPNWQYSWGGVIYKVEEMPLAG